MTLHDLTSKKFTGETMLHAVYAYWASNFGCDTDAFDTAGSTAIPRDSLQGTNTMYVYPMKKHAVLRMDPELIPRVKALVKQQNQPAAVTLKDFETYFGKSRVICEDSYPHYYLDPINFTPASRRDDVIIRRLAQSEYNRLHELFDACKEHDIDEADIWLDRPDPVVFCGFMDETIVAYASHRYLSAYGDDRCFGDEIAELGVLIHPDYRGKGLGKAVISALSQWCIDHDKIPQYQTNQSHVGSRRIPESLRYTRLFDVLLIEVKP